MKWWRADATDREGGGDFFARCLPTSAPFAAIDAARRSAMVVDEERRRTAVATGDQYELLTLFHLGSAYDRQVEDRFRYRRAQKTLAKPTTPVDPASLARDLAALATAPPVEPVPDGRRIRRRVLPFDAAKVDALVVALPVSPHGVVQVRAVPCRAVLSLEKRESPQSTVAGAGSPRHRRSNTSPLWARWAAIWTTTRVGR